MSITAISPVGLPTISPAAEAAFLGQTYGTALAAIGTPDVSAPLPTAPRPAVTAVAGVERIGPVERVAGDNPGSTIDYYA